jgi:hypothetical protein
VLARQFIRLGMAGAREWGRRPVAIIGGGPSLARFDFSRLQGRFTVLAVNASIFDLPWADAGFSIDRRAARIWWPRLITEVHMPLVFAVPDPWLVNFAGAPTPNMTFIRRVQSLAFSEHPAQIAAGGTSGFGALNYAVLKGAQKIVLLGFDYGPRAGVWHHNQQHYAFPHRQNGGDWAQWARNFDGVAPGLKARGIEVLNASPASAITAFPRVSIEEALQ